MTSLSDCGTVMDRSGFQDADFDFLLVLMHLLRVKHISISERKNLKNDHYITVGQS